MSLLTHPSASVRSKAAQLLGSIIVAQSTRANPDGWAFQLTSMVLSTSSEINQLWPPSSSHFAHLRDALPESVKLAELPPLTHTLVHDTLGVAKGFEVVRRVRRICGILSSIAFALDLAPSLGQKSFPLKALLPLIDQVCTFLGSNLQHHCPTFE